MYNEVELQYLKYARVWGKTLLFTREKALDLVTDLEHRSMPILGIDVFRIVGDSIQPVLELGVDFSSVKCVCEDTWESSRALLSGNFEEVFLFEIVC